MALTPKQKSYLIYKSLQKFTKKEEDLLKYYEIQWHLRHHVPTIEETAQYLKLKQTEVNYFLSKTAVTKALEKRGIPWRQHSQSELTATQVAAAITMMNFADTRSNEDKLDQLGIQSATYYAWLNDPQFKNLIDNLSEQNLRNIKPTAIGEFTKLINKGDWRAVHYYLDVTGALRTEDAPQTEDLIKVFVEIIQRHVKDPETVMAIAKDLKAASGNRTLEVVNPHEAITADYVENDPDLEQAKKMLGVM